MLGQFLMSMFSYCILLLPFYLLARFLLMKRKKITFGREAIMLLFFCYCVSIFSQTIIPDFWIGNGQLKFATTDAMRGNFIPFATIHNYIEQLQGPIARIAFYNLAGNVVLFIPFGFFIPLLWQRFRSIGTMLLLSFCIPLFIEGTQYFIGRSSDIDDVLLNAIAIFLGYGSYLLVNFIKIKRKRL